MLILGAGGFAKEVLEIFHQQNDVKDIAFYDDIRPACPDFLYDTFPIIKTEPAAKEFLASHGNTFTIGIGNPALRLYLYKKFVGIGARVISSISPLAVIGNFDVEIGTGANVLANAIFSNSVKIGICCLIYYNVLIAHDCSIGDFVELSPMASLLGHVRVGSFSHIGAGATVLPGITVGTNVIVGAGTTVTKDVPDNSVVVGSPGKIIRKLEPMNPEDLIVTYS